MAYQVPASQWPSQSYGSQYGQPQQQYGRQYGQPLQQPGVYGQQYSQPQQAQASYGQSAGAPAQYGQPRASGPAQYGQSAPQQAPASQPQQPATPQQATTQQAPAAPVADAAIANWFRMIDTDGSGFLDAAELQRALAAGNLHYGLSDTDQMVRAFDTRGSRSLSLQEFMKLHEFLTNVTLSFKYFDTDRSMSLELDEVVQALTHAGFRMEPPVVQAMFRRHDPSNTNTLTLDEYIRMCLFLQSCVRTFGAFDTQRTGRITLDFNQFVYAGSHLA